MSEQKTILVVDDEPDVLIYLTALFEDNGFDTMEAEDGIKALELARSSKPDLITLDITMPEQSGFKTYRYLKSDIELKSVPVIIITAMGENIGNVINKFTGFPQPEGFMSKPIDQKKLIELASALTYDL